jgi:hypothetical protein
VLFVPNVDTGSRISKQIRDASIVIMQSVGVMGLGLPVKPIKALSD